MAEIYYVCPKCGCYQFITSNVKKLSNEIKKIDKSCVYCNEEKVLISINKDFRSEEEFNNHILNTYLKNYPQFNEDLYIQRMNKIMELDMINSK